MGNSRLSRDRAPAALAGGARTDAFATPFFLSSRFPPKPLMTYPVILLLKLLSQLKKPGRDLYVLRYITAFICFPNESKGDVFHVLPKSSIGY